MADVANYLKRNNIVYAEISWTSFLYLKRGSRFYALIEVTNEAQIAHHIADRVHFLIDIQRDHGFEAGTWVYHQVFASRADIRIVGVGLTGHEEGFSPADYHMLYREAQERGLGLIAHAGKYGTAEDIGQCIRTLGVTRIMVLVLEGRGFRRCHKKSFADRRWSLKGGQWSRRY